MRTYSHEHVTLPLMREKYPSSIRSQLEVTSAVLYWYQDEPLSTYATEVSLDEISYNDKIELPTATHDQDNMNSTQPRDVRCHCINY